MRLVCFVVYMKRCSPESLVIFVCSQMVRMSTGHMEGDLQPLYLLLTDCYIYLLRKGEGLLLITLSDTLFLTVSIYLSLSLSLCLCVMVITFIFNGCL